MNTDSIKGIIVPILTPVDEQENVNEKKLRDQVNHVIEGGVHGILAFGSNGEFYMFDYEETKFALEIMIDAAKGRVPIYLGIGDIRTKNCVRLAKMAKEVEADGISVLQPMFLKPTEDELYSHFKTIADAVEELPMLLYNNPDRTGYTMSGNLVERLARDVENIVGMKDSSGDLTQLSEFIRRTKDINFKVLGGKDTLVYAGLCIGAVGSVCSTANMFPKLVCGIYNKYVAGDYEKSLEDQFILNPVRLSQDKASFPVATKDMSNLMGLDIGEPILPNTPTTGNVLDNMKNEMINAKLLD